MPITYKLDPRFELECQGRSTDEIDELVAAYEALFAFLSEESGVEMELVRAEKSGECSQWLSVTQCLERTDAGWAWDKQRARALAERIRKHYGDE